MAFSCSRNVPVEKGFGFKITSGFYDNLVSDTVREMGRLVNFLDVDGPLPEKVDYTCLKKWMDMPVSEVDKVNEICSGINWCEGIGKENEYGVENT